MQSLASLSPSTLSICSVEIRPKVATSDMVLSFLSLATSTHTWSELIPRFLDLPPLFRGFMPILRFPFWECRKKVSSASTIPERLQSSKFFMLSKILCLQLKAVGMLTSALCAVWLRVCPLSINLAA